jgi:hypothetical protein
MAFSPPPISLQVTSPQSITLSLSNGIEEAPEDGGYYARHNGAWAALGSMALQAATAVAILGGTIDGTAIGGTTPAAGAFTTVSTSSDIDGAGGLNIAGSGALGVNLTVGGTLGVSGAVTLGDALTMAGAFTVGGETILGGETIVGGLLQTAASSSAGAGINLTPGAAPTSPNNGDLWSTSTGFYGRVNGATVGPFSSTTGTVTSVGLALPSSILTVSGSPVTTSGTLTGTLATQTANYVWAGPTSGSAAAPTFRALVTADIPWATPGTIGSGTPNTGAFTTISATGVITSTLSTGTAPFTVSSTTAVANLNVSLLLGNTWAAPGTIGGTTPGLITGTTITANTGFTGPIGGASAAAGAFTTISATGVITSTLAIGTAPFSITSTTVVPNLNVSQLLGGTWAVPGTIGSTTPSTGKFTSVSTPTFLTTAGFTFTDSTNTTNPIVYTAGAIGAGYVTFANTLDATAIGTASVVMAGGLSVASQLRVGTTATFNGTSITVGTSTGTGPSIFLNRAASNSALVVFQTAGSNVWTFGCNTSNDFTLYDATNGVNQLVCYPGALTASYIAFQSTLDATNSTTAGITAAGGLAVAKSGWFGTTVTTVNGHIQCNTTSGNANLVANAPTGSSAVLLFEVNSSNLSSISGSATYAFEFYDQVNSTNVCYYTAGSISAGYWTFANTTASTTATTGAVVITGGLGVSGNTFHLGSVNIQNAHSLGNAILIGEQGTGIGNGQFWGLGIRQSGLGDLMTLAQSSTTYTTGGALAWVGNNISYLYTPSSFRIGTTVGANAYTEHTSTALNVGSSLIFTSLNVTDASNSTTAGMVTSGGLAVAKSLWVGTNINTAAGNIEATQASGTASTLTLNQSGVRAWIMSNVASTGVLTFNPGSGAVFTLSGTGAALITPLVTTSGTQSAFTITAPANTTQTSGTEINSANFNFSRTLQWATSTPTIQREFLIQGPTYSCDTAAQTITTAATLAITNNPQAGTNVTLTNSYTLWVQSGPSLFSGNVFVDGSSGLQIVQATAAGGTRQALTITPAANVSILSGTASPAVLFNGVTRQWATSTPTTQAEWTINAPTYACDTASQTITTAATLAITNTPQAGTNVTITNKYSLWVQAGYANFDGGIRIAAGHIQTDTSTGLQIATSVSQKLGFFNTTPVVQPGSPSGYATVITGGSVNIVYTNTTWSGGIGSTAYTIGDLVIALKNLGLIAA